MPTGKYDRTKSKLNSGLFKRGHVVPQAWKNKLRKILRGKTGSNANRWKGGVCIDKDGYVLIYKPDHPNCSKDGYVREHRLIVESYLGRYLKPSECIHHLNGLKNDNRIENLKVIENKGIHLKLFHKRNPLTKIAKKCKFCNKEFNIFKCKVKWGRGIFCSRECYQRYGLFTVKLARKEKHYKKWGSLGQT